MKAIKIVLLVLIFVFLFVPTTLAANTKTIDSYIPIDEGIEEHWAYDEMDDLISADIIDGFMEDGVNMYVKPNEKITRAQFVKIIVNALGLTSEGSGKTFSDVKQGIWYSEPIRIASDLEIIDGKGEGKFSPNDNITRAEMTKIIVLAFNKSINFPASSGMTFTDVASNYWANEFISKAAGAKIVEGYGQKFLPKNPATRAEAMAMIHRALQQEQSNVPSDEELTTFLADHIKRENDLAITMDVDAFKKLYEENGTGYYKTEMIEYSALGLPTEEGEEEMMVEINDDHLQLSILKKSNRFATFEATGMTISIKYSSPDMNFDTTQPMDGTYQLKKDPLSGEWKIYSYMPSFDEEMLEELEELE